MQDIREPQSNDVIRLLRLVALFMLVTLIPASVALLNVTDLSSAWYLLLRVGVMWVPIVFIFTPGLERWLGKRYLPTALFLFITTLAIELTVQASRQLAWRLLIQADFNPESVVSTWRGELFLFLLLPIVLAAWAYGRQGAMRAATWAIALHIVGGLWLWHSDGAVPDGYWKNMPTRLIVLYAVPLLVAYLATRQRRQHEALQAAHEHLQRQAALTEELAVSRERNRLARDLHDTLAHSLAGLVVELEAIGTLFDLGSKATRAELNKAQALARAGLDKARAAIRDLRESPAQDLGLGTALRQLVNDFGARTGLQSRAEFVISGPFPSLPPETSAALYRIAQEALSNVERHASATSATLRVEATDDALTLTIADDGVGFEPNSAPDGHYGMLGMRERAEMVGAELKIQSEPGAGTRVNIRLVNKPTRSSFNA